MNTNFVKNYRSYQLDNVNMHTIKILTFLMLQNVYKNINQLLNGSFCFFRKRLECKQIGKDYCLIEKINSEKL